MTAPTPARSSRNTLDGSEHDQGMESSEEGQEEEEEVAFVPLQMGCAEATLPGFLKVSDMVLWGLMWRVTY